MYLEEILTALGGASAVLLAVAYLVKKLIGQFLEKDLERFKDSIRSQGEKEIVNLKASLELEAQKQMIQFGSLHTRRAEIIAEFYDKLTHVQKLTQALPWNLILRDYKAENGHPKLQGLSDQEEKDIQKLSDAWRELSEFYRMKKIYFSAPVCDEIDRIQTITGFISANYQNVAFKSESGELYVHPEVKRVWDASHLALPKAMARLESEFRALLGVSS